MRAQSLIVGLRDKDGEGEHDDDDDHDDCYSILVYILYIVVLFLLFPPAACKRLKPTGCCYCIYDYGT